MDLIKKGIYRHYKGKSYEVLGTAHHSETLEEFVVYRALYKTRFGRNSLWIRPRKMFSEKIILGGMRVPRFKFVHLKLKAVKPLSKRRRKHD
jgi:hypothetical protein